MSHSLYPEIIIALMMFWDKSIDQSSYKIQYVNNNNLPVLVQFTYTGPPKILPIATADSYPEGSTINLICTVSGGQRKGLSLSWMKDGNQIDETLFLNNNFKNNYSNNQSEYENVSVEKTGADISILRISNATYINSGKYSCSAKNALGEDSTSVNIVINGLYNKRLMIDKRDFAMRQNANYFQ